jgi:lipopolysaccharide/colanic/teichoic acid biosynthesis glycosyltransferase
MAIGPLRRAKPIEAGQKMSVQKVRKDNIAPGHGIGMKLGPDLAMREEDPHPWVSTDLQIAPSDMSRVRSPWYRHGGKRAFDIAIAFVGLLIMALPMVGLSVAICFLDGLPIVFRQTRVGRQGKSFAIFKFRTMSKSAGQTSTITAQGDNRITSLGRWLRRFKLDELPQLWNVLRGDMSFVGPRPDVPGYLDALRGEAQALWELRPGITGPATLLFRREEEMLAAVEDHIRFNDEVIYPEKVRLNLIYMRRCSFWLDLGYILATVAPSISRRLGLERRLGLDYRAFESKMASLIEKASPR